MLVYSLSKNTPGSLLGMYLDKINTAMKCTKTQRQSDYEGNRKKAK